MQNNSFNTHKTYLYGPSKLTTLKNLVCHNNLREATHNIIDFLAFPRAFDFVVFT